VPSLRRDKTATDFSAVLRDNPQLHQAMTALEQPDVEPNTVLNVFQKGYTLHGRLVRPAMVVVSKAGE